MVIRNCSSNVSFGPRRYRVEGSGGNLYVVYRFHDGAMTCSCPHFEFHIKTPVYDLKDGCKHMTSAVNGEAGKPRVRATVRPPRPTVRRVTVSAEARERMDLLDVG
jgi:hypothetical protein